MESGMMVKEVIKPVDKKFRGGKALKDLKMQKMSCIKMRNDLREDILSSKIADAMGSLRILTGDVPAELPSLLDKLSQDREEMIKEEADCCIEIERLSDEINKITGKYKDVRN